MIKSVLLKLGKMRKAQEFIVYPYKIGDTTIRIQSEKSIGIFDKKTGEGIMNFKSSYLPQNGTAYKLTQEELKALLDTQLYPGEQINTCLFVASN